MEKLINYFEHIPSLHRSLILAGGIAFFWLLESAVPLVSFRYNKWRHAGVNFFFTFTSIVVNFCLAFILLRTSDYVSTHHFGLLQWGREVLGVGYWASNSLHLIPNTQYLIVECIVGLLLLDLVGAWSVHYVEHRVKWMWRFHIIHHSDQFIDTTSANRHHPGESVFRFIFTTAAVVICGAPMWLVFMYQTMSVVLTQFNHANITLPKVVDDVLSWVIVSPDMHKVHHHYVLPYTDSNYGNIFSVWDRLFGTFMKLDREKIVYGIDTFPDSKENAHIPQLLKIPFMKYRSPVGAKFQEYNNNQTLDEDNSIRKFI